MRLRTSYFNTTVLKKDITRFAPVWGLYSVFLLILLWRPWNFFREMTYPIFAYGAICAVTLFGDMYDPRMSRALHAMPMRREGWFLTHTAAGILFFLVPTGLFSLACALCYPAMWINVSVALAYTTLQFLFFFGVALLCVMLSGNRVGAIMIYIIFNFLALVIYWLASEFYQPTLYGIPHDIVEKTFPHKISPVLYIAQVASGYGYFYSCMLPGGFFWDGDWGYLLSCSGIGVLFAALALLLYRRRRLETDGEMILVKWLGHLIVLVFSLMFAVAIFKLIGHDTEQYLLLVPYMAVGFLIGRMVVEKRFLVFQWKPLVGMAVLIAVICGSIHVIQTDALDRVRYVPETEDVQYVRIYVERLNTVGQKLDYCSENFEEEGRTVYLPADIEKITDAHRSLSRAKPREDTTAMAYLSYRLKNGTTFYRYYPLKPYGEEWTQIERAVSTRQAIFGDVDWDEYRDSVYYIRVSPSSGGGKSFYFGNPEYVADAKKSDIKINKKSAIRGFLNAVNISCRQGTMRQLEYSRYDVEVKSRDDDGREKTTTFVIAWPISEASEYIDMCRENGRMCEDRTITEDTVLRLPPY